MGNRQTSMGGVWSFFNLYACRRPSICSTAVHERYIVCTPYYVGEGSELTFDSKQYRMVCFPRFGSSQRSNGPCTNTSTRWYSHRSRSGGGYAIILHLLLSSPFFVFRYSPPCRTYYIPSFFPLATLTHRSFVSTYRTLVLYRHFTIVLFFVSDLYPRT